LRASTSVGNSGWLTPAACRQGVLSEGKNGSPAHLNDRFPTDRCLWIQKDQYGNSGFSGRTRMPSVAWSPMASELRENTVAKLEKGDFNSPSDDCQGPQQGSSIRGFAWRVVRCPGRTAIKLVTGVRQDSTFLEVTAASSPLVFSFDHRVCQGLCGSQKEDPSGLLSRCGVMKRVVPIPQLPGSPSGICAAEQESEWVDRCSDRIANRLCTHVRSVGGRFLDSVAVLHMPCMRGRCQQQG